MYNKWLFHSLTVKSLFNLQNVINWFKCKGLQNCQGRQDEASDRQLHYYDK